MMHQLCWKARDFVDRTFGHQHVSEQPVSPVEVDHPQLLLCIVPDHRHRPAPEPRVVDPHPFTGFRPFNVQQHGARGGNLACRCWTTHLCQALFVGR